VLVYNVLSVVEIGAASIWEYINDMNVKMISVYLNLENIFFNIAII
jgi:hypothetical protein